MRNAVLRARYARLGLEAKAATVQRLSPRNGVPFGLAEISTRALAAIEGWSSSYYDWRAILRRYDDPDRLDVALWSGEALLALGLATTGRTALRIEVVEANPAAGALLKGQRLFILLDVFANYAQLRSRTELRLVAKNPALATLYEDAFGFERVLSNENVLYWRRSV
jgi:hypothetical protein